MPKRKTVLVIGLGRFGEALCKRLIEKDYYIIGIDINMKRVEEFSDLLDLAVQADATDQEALIEVGAKSCDIAVVTLGKNIQASILTTTLLKDIGIPKVIARATDVLHARILARVGANKVIFPEKEMGQKLADIISKPWIEDFNELTKDYLIGQVKPLKEIVNKSIAESNFSTKFNLLILLVKREENYIFPKSELTILPKDKLLIIGKEKDIERYIKLQEKEK